MSIDSTEIIRKIIQKELNSSDYEQITFSLISKRILFGHLKRLRHHSMSKYIMFSQNQIDIMNPYSVIFSLREAYKNIVQSNKIMVIFSNKMTDRGNLSEVVDLCNTFKIPYIASKWQGGMISNFSNTIQSLQRMEDFENQINVVSKRNVKKLLLVKRKFTTLSKNLSGIKMLKNTSLPDLLFSFSAKNDAIALQEARKIGIKTIALSDSNADISYIDVPVIGNDDIRFSTKFFIDFLRLAIMDKNEKN